MRSVVFEQGPWASFPALVRGSALLAAMLLVATLTACGGSDKKADEAVSAEASLVAVEVKGDSEIESYDLNGDGKPDMQSVYTLKGGPEVPKAQRTRLLARKELDVNFDGTMDVKQFFNEAGIMIRESMDLDFDRKVDAIDYYQEGAKYKREMYTNFVERPSIWKYYDQGRVVRKERDTTGDGKPDTFEYYEDGKLARVGYDRNGDGKPDLYEEADKE